MQFDWFSFALQLPLLFPLSYYYWRLLEPRYSYAKSLLIFTVFYLLSSFLILHHPSGGPIPDVWIAVLLYACNVAPCIACLRLLTRSDFRAVLLFYGLTMILTGAGSLAVCYAYPALARRFGPPSAAVAQNATYIVDLLTVLVRGVLLISVCGALRHRFFKRQAEVRWGAFGLVTLAQACLTLFAAYFVFFRVSTPWTYALFAMIACLTMVADIYLLKTMGGIAEATELKKEIQLLEQQQTLQHRQYQAISEQMLAMRRIRHDYSNTMQTIDSLLRSGEYERAAAIVEETGHALTSAVRVYSGNQIVDAVLFSKLAEAEHAGIRVQTQLLLPSPLLISERDLMSVFTNLFDNAIEYCRSLPPERERRIEISSRGQYNMLKLCFSNTFDGTEPPLSGVAKTSKPDEENHGYGLAIVRGIAEKYHGVLTGECEAGMLHITVLLNL